jgi:hypothetical protein
MPAYRKVRMDRKRPQVLGVDLNRSESSRPPLPFARSQRDRAVLERTADPLYRAGVNSKLFGNDADTGPSRSRQSLTDSFLEYGAIGGCPRRLPSPRPARGQHGRSAYRQKFLNVSGDSPA